MQRAIANDRRWFERHPEAVVRFRRARAGEFHPVLAMGESIPTFIPPGFQTSAPLNWVAVVELMRALGETSHSQEGSIRVRVRTISIRSKLHQAKASTALTRAIATELLQQVSASKGRSDASTSNIA